LHGADSVRVNQAPVVGFFGGQPEQITMASKVIRKACRLFEQEESNKNELINELKKGEASGLIEGFDRKEFLKTLRFHQ